ncbi:hypothetical protein H9Q72_006959 [Fusarium xylarioides]|uniref:Carboxylic ester hydrolase n=1 Tax=Fusarium xylarioides TaxID=221167 RepID=A0A9P7HS81_9HYPO|nr:hypothetical protein H9Q72_006959 [Fusarium xylarioides]
MRWFEMRLSFHFTLVLELVISPGAAMLQQNGFGTKCADITTTSLHIANATVWFSQFVTAGTNLSLPENDPSCDHPYQLVSEDVCRITLRVDTSPTSSTNIEVWLPADWNGRFLSTGNGGLNGCVTYQDMAYTTSLGFAAVGTNNGHNGTSAAPLLDKPEIVNDFAWRSVHTGALIGKAITADFYGRGASKSYYLGCSTGGRQGMMSAQSFPDDFDGIVAGAPALAFNSLSAWAGHFYDITGPPDSSTFVPESYWTTIIHNDIMRQCDELDGFKDAIIEDASICNYDPTGLTCRPSQNQTSCLTKEQVETVRKAYSPLKFSNGTLIYPRLGLGAELNGSPAFFFTGQPFILASDWYRYAVYNDPDWDPTQLKESDYAYGIEKNPGHIQTFNGDLSSFRNRGGKLLHFHGQEDPLITCENSPWYYEHVSQTMELSSAQLDSFYRFFRISGLSHCDGGAGAGLIGQSGQSNAGLDPDQNVLMSLVRWVEQGIPPDTILGTAVKPGTAPSSGGIGEIAFQRRHCRYPYRNAYTGKGDAADPGSWACI